MPRKKPHKAWAMLFGCCMLQGGCMGLINNCRGIFYAPIIRELGFSSGAFTFYMLVSGIFTCIMAPFAGKIFEKVNSKLLLGGMSVLFSGSVIAMGFFNTLPAFYIAGAVQGFATAFLMFFPAPFILGNWFKKSGFAVGVSSATAGVIGILFNPIGNAVIERFGWRVGYWSFGILCLVMMLPVSVFLLRLRPEDEGLLPYGIEKKSGEEAPKSDMNKGVPSTIVKKSIFFWMLIVAGTMTSVCGSFNSHLSSLGQAFGYSASTGAMLISISMCGNVAGKILIGRMHDRFGLRATVISALSISLIGFLMLQIDVLAVRKIGALLYGFCMAVGNILNALIIKDLYGRKSYGELLSFTSFAVSLGNSLGVFLPGLVVDLFGGFRGYHIFLWVGAGIVVTVTVLFMTAIYGGHALAVKYKKSAAAQTT